MKFRVRGWYTPSPHAQNLRAKFSITPQKRLSWLLNAEKN
ncbi:Hypothetical protein ABZS17H1_03078 [Kosakonia cowanii]